MPKNAAVTDTQELAVATERYCATSLLKAALALPGLANGLKAQPTLPRLTAATLATFATLATLAMPSSSCAEAAPDTSTIDFKYLYYRDWQPGGSRMRVSAPSVHFVMPLENRFALEGAFVMDAMSGASPLYHDTLSGASGKGVNDLRKAGDLKLTRTFDRVAVGVGFAYSTEHDYVSRTFNTDVRISSADNNTTLALGGGRSSDDIDSVNGVARGRSKRTSDLLLGVTQVITASDIVQSNLTYAFGHGYYDDPYKAVDVRPDSREQLAWLTRWNHHFAAPDATLRLSARYYRDTWGIRAITLGAEWVQPYGAWTLTPSFRYYAQGAADFYRGPPFPQGFVPGRPYSADQRLSAFGAMTPGLKIARYFGDGWRTDFKVEYYEQKSEWRRFVDEGNKGVRDLKPLKAMFYQVGLTKEF